MPKDDYTWTTQLTPPPDPCRRTFLILEQVLPRLKFAAQKLDAVISKVVKRYGGWVASLLSVH